MVDRYEPGVDPSFNHSKTNPLFELAVLLIGLALIVVGLFVVSQFAVDQLVNHMPRAWETKIYGDHFPDLQATKIAGSDRDSLRPDLHGLVDELLPCAVTDLAPDERLALTDPSVFAFQPLWVEQTHPNAFAIPGGRIWITTGMLNDVRTRNGLAFVVAHELAHFIHRDHLRAQGRALVWAGLSQAIFGQDTGLGSVVNTGLLLPTAIHSRDAESAADKRALRTIACVYGHVSGAHEFFNARLTALQDGVAAEGDPSNHLLSTHPETQQRINELNREIQRAGYQTNGDRLPLFGRSR